MSTSVNLYKSAKIIQERRDLINIFGTRFTVLEAKVIAGGTSELVRCKIELIIHSEITSKFVSFIEKLMPDLSNPDICDFSGSITIEYDYEI